MLRTSVSDQVPAALSFPKMEDNYTEDPDFSKNVALYKEEAEKRAKLVSDTKYELLLALQKGDTFNGHITVSFHLDPSYTKSNEKDLFLDYHGLGVKDLVINGKSVDSEKAFNRQRVWFDKDLLKPGKTNKVSLSFKSKYRNDGEGPHHFVDSEDGAEYIYTQFEAFFAHRAFPVFDQPSIKASLKLRVLAPEDWVVVANGQDTAIRKQTDGEVEKALTHTDKSIALLYNEPFRMFEFTETPKISSYLYAFIAGPFDYIEQESKIYGKKDPLRLRVYFRKSVREDVERVQDMMFDPIVKGIEWYSQYFNHPFPFDKYDQIFCPEFKYGAMENVGAVTFSERLLYRGKEISEADRTQLINTALHELAHMWFGNLVTMHWWNDLWLNEAFATFISFYAMAQIESIQKITPSLWINVNQFKHMGYNDDEMSTTHPIFKNAPHTDSAGDMINGITYGKGCAFLQQLHFLVGPETFNKAIQLYFKKHAWKNTYLDDLVDALVEAYKTTPHTVNDLDVKAWAMKFLSTKGVNTLEIEENDKHGLILKQTLGEYSNSLIHQRLKILAFDEHLNKTVYTTMTSDKDPITPLPFKTKKDKRMYILNEGDKAYAKIFLDERTSEFLSHHLDKLDDIMTRNLVWRALMGMIKMRKIRATLFFDYIENNLAHEKHPVLIRNILQSANGAAAFYIPDDQFVETNKKMFKFVYRLLLETKQQDVIDILNANLFNFLVGKIHNS